MERRRRTYRNAIYGLAGTTIAVALLHVAGVGGGSDVGRALEFTAIVLPAAGAAAAGIREHGQFRFHAERCRRAATRLSALVAARRDERTLERIRELVVQAESVMQDERATWAGVAEFQELELVV
jgi:hypothetical protein